MARNATIRNRQGQTRQTTMPDTVERVDEDRQTMGGQRAEEWEKELGGTLEESLRAVAVRWWW